MSIIYENVQRVDDKHISFDEKTVRGDRTVIQHHSKCNTASFQQTIDRLKKEKAQHEACVTDCQRSIDSAEAAKSAMESRGVRFS